MPMTQKKIVEMLTHSYCMEIETVMNYLANSINPDGVRAEQIKQALAADIAEEITHAQQLGQRIKQLGETSQQIGEIVDDFQKAFVSPPTTTMLIFSGSL